MRVTDAELARIPGLIRVETSPMDEVFAKVDRDTLDSYPAEQVYGEYCTLHDYIDCPPRELYHYLADIRSLEEYTLSVRDLKPTDEEGLWVGVDAVGSATTKIYAKVEANPDAMTVDYHCAWDQGKELWMVYLYRVVDAEVVFGRPGSVLLWTNCHHPYYTKNPYPELAPAPDRMWVGDFWHQFYAGHKLELDNLKAILEYRHANGIRVEAP
jgi:hypothetical protein